MPKYTKRKDGRYQTKVAIGGGEYKYLYAKSSRELERKVTELKIKIGKGIDVQAENETFLEWAERWLQFKEATVSHGRYNICKYRVNNLEKIHYFPIKKIRTADIQEIIYDLHKQGKSECVLKEVKQAARQVLQLAVDNRVIEYNCADNVKIIKTEKPEPRRALTEEEQAWIREPSEDHPIAHRMAMIMLYAGLRKGEVLALMWNDIDFEKKTITVNKSVEYINNQPKVKPRTKTAAGMRTVFIPQLLVDFLENEPKGTNLLVCPNKRGNVMSQTVFSYSWNSYQKELNRKFGDFSGIIKKDKKGNIYQYTPKKNKYEPHEDPIVIPSITAHMLRHTFITMMYMAGIDVLTAKEQAGHSDIQTTLGIYTHLNSVYKEKEVTKLNEFLTAK